MLQEKVGGNKKTNMQNEKLTKLMERWTSILRSKAHEYEHEERGRGKEPVSPTLDDIAWEIEAFFIGIDA